MALFVTMSQTRQEELQWQQCTLAISTERSTSHPLVGVPMILNPAISRARVNMEEHHFTFLLPQWILFRQLFYFMCASCGHLKCEHSRQGCFFNVGIGKCNFHAFAKCNVKKEDHARFGMVSGYYCQIGHWQGGQWL